MGGWWKREDDGEDAKMMVKIRRLMMKMWGGR